MKTKLQNKTRLYIYTNRGGNHSPKYVPKIYFLKQNILKISAIMYQKYRKYWKIYRNIRK